MPVFAFQHPGAEPGGLAQQAYDRAGAGVGQEPAGGGVAAVLFEGEPRRGGLQYQQVDQYQQGQRFSRPEFSPGFGEKARAQQGQERQYRQHAARRGGLPGFYEDDQQRQRPGGQQQVVLGAPEGGQAQAGQRGGRHAHAQTFAQRSPDL